MLLEIHLRKTKSRVQANCWDVNLLALANGDGIIGLYKYICNNIALLGRGKWFNSALYEQYTTMSFVETPSTGSRVNRSSIP